MSGERVVLVDALNVMRSRWPNIGGERFVDLTRAWAEAEEVRVVAVFDRLAPGVGTGSHRLDEWTTLVGTDGQSADDWIAQYAAEMAKEPAVLWLVTSDRELRERVSGNVERVIGGGAFAETLGVPVSARGS